MENQKTKFKKLERLREVVVVVFVLLGLVIVQFPFPGPNSDQPVLKYLPGVYIACIFLVVFVFLWHRLLPKKLMDSEMKFFIETLVYTTAIMFIVNFTGGTYSYLNFLYFFPVLNTAANLPLRYTLASSIYSSVVMSFHLTNNWGTREFGNAFSLYILNFFGIWLVTALGRFLATELIIIQRRQQEFQVEQLRQLDKLKDEFVFIIAHELRSPITAIRGYLELITTDPKIKIDQALRNLLLKSFSTGSKIATIIGLLLEVARIETGKIRFYFQKIDLKEAVNFALHDLRRQIDQKEIDLTVSIPDETLVLIDKERLEEILTIIIENATSFTPEFGKILINTQTTDKHILLSISDTGVGIPEEVKNKIFEKFYTENTKTGEVKLKGYGIGLYVSKQLLLRMGGDISVESIVGRGTTFTIHLPKYWSFGI
jgi:signal transduction histidine kinase